MSKKEIKIISQNLAYDGYLKIHEAVINETDEAGKNIQYTRFKLTRPDAVAILIYNSDEDAVVLVKQHRYPAEGKVTGDIYEIVAGKVDEGEEPKDTAVREIKEEVGYDVNADEMRYKSSYFPSVGYSSEIIHLYVVQVTNADKTSDGGGVEGEHENIEIHNVPVKRFFDMISGGEIVDGKTIMAADAFWHLRNDHFVQLGQQYKKILEDEKSNEQ